MIFLPNIQFFKNGHKMLYTLLWASKLYKFKWLLRLHDDLFIYLPIYLKRIPENINPLTAHFIKGYLHCLPDITRIDDSLMMMSWHTFKKLLDQPLNEFVCNRFSDQTIAIWVDYLKIGNPWYKDPYYSFRQYNPKEDKNEFYTKICNIRDIHAVHQVLLYEDMKIMYDNCKNTQIDEMPTLPLLQCGFPDYQRFMWDKFDDLERHEPKKCLKSQ